MKTILTTKKYLILSMLLFSVMAITSCTGPRRSIAIEEGWELLGEQKVNFVRDKDEIEVKSRSKFTAIRFKVEDREAQLNYLKIYFDNGDKLEPSLKDVISTDQYSRYIELGAEGRFIDKIEFKYRTTGNILKGRASVLIFGKRYAPFGY